MFKKMIDRRNQKIKDEKKEAGFNWAMSGYFLHNLSIYALESYIRDEGEIEFDKGAIKAIRIITEYKRDKKKCATFHAGANGAKVESH